MNILYLSIGPWCYRMLAEDRWGQHMLETMSSYVHCLCSDPNPTRIIHLLENRLMVREVEAALSGVMPTRLVRGLSVDLPKTGWRSLADRCGQFFWYHPATRHAIWSYDPFWDNFKESVPLPWQAILVDALANRGGIIHGGLVVRGDSAFILTAPSGGGKTTAVARIPPPWRALSDDAALLLPVDDGGFVAYPLPNWMGDKKLPESIPDAVNCPMATCHTLGAIILLKQAKSQHFSRIGSLDSIQHVHRALKEHARVWMVADQLPHVFIPIVADLVKVIPLWELELARDSPYWHIVESALFQEAKS